MIPVTQQDEPPSFDVRVRKPGLAWLRSHKIPLGSPLPPRTAIEPYWTRCLDDLHRSYSGVCAYVSVYVERGLGGTSVDHFIAKSQLAGRAYDWDNYRLACAQMNANKGKFHDVLDPFTLAADTFFLELITGRIYANPALTGQSLTDADATLVRLGLDEPVYRQLRANRYTWYVADPTSVARQRLRVEAPFVWYEANRQGLL
ncbi:MAG: hypothetical protein U0271_48675 [Polyangiaceae bacterium]